MIILLLYPLPTSYKGVGSQALMWYGFEFLYVSTCTQRGSMFDTSFRKNNLVEIVDSVMGSNKTNRIIEWMDNNPQNNYIYVSPLLSEVVQGSRLHKMLNNIVLEIPNNDYDSKSESLYSMLLAGDNIACTHSLYLSMQEKHFNEISKKGYVIIIDEEVDVIGGFSRYSKSDMKWLVNKGDLSISDEDGMVSWIGDRTDITGKHKYLDFLSYCDSKSLYCTRRSDTMAVTQLPIRLFECAKQVIILTYMFEGNILDCFLRLKGFDVQEFKGIIPDKLDKDKIRKLLTVIPPTDKMSEYSLSSTWFSEANGKQLNDVSNYIRTIANRMGYTNQDVMWTVPKGRAVRGANKSKKLVRPVSYSMYKDKDGTKKPCWLAAQTRATNIYSDKKLMVHCYNRHPILAVSSYLQDYGNPVDLKVFATSELLQWSWRGCIRKAEPMTLAIGSKRMHNYFMEWLEDGGDE